MPSRVVVLDQFLVQRKLILLLAEVYKSSGITLQTTYICKIYSSMQPGVMDEWVMVG